MMQYFFSKHDEKPTEMADELQQQLDTANEQLNVVNTELARLRNEQQARAVEGNPRHEIGRVAMKNVPFLVDHPDLYFMQIEAQFRTANISVDQTKFDHAIALFDPKHLSKISDFLRDPPRTGKYDAFKARILTEFTDSDQKKLRKLIEGIELGDDKPSQLLKKMKDLAGTAITDDAIKTLFVSRLPETVRGIIAIAEGNSAVWAKQADKMMETAQFTSVSAVSAKPTANNSGDLHNEIAALRKEIAELKTSRGRSFSRSKQRDRSNSNARPKSTNKVCYYHTKFGEEARKCAEPCYFAATAKKSEN